MAMLPPYQPDMSTTDEHAQPMPVRNDRPSIQSLVRQDLDAREQVGISRYGTSLQPHNGRDMLRDAYDEAMDLTTYLRGVIEERDNPADLPPASSLQNRFAAELDGLVSEFIHPNAFGGYDVDFARLAEIAQEFYAPVFAAKMVDAYDQGHKDCHRDQVEPLRAELDEHLFKLNDALGIVAAEDDIDPYEAVASLHTEIDRLRGELVQVRALLDAMGPELVPVMASLAMSARTHGWSDSKIRDEARRTMGVGQYTEASEQPRVWQKDAREPAGVERVRDVHGDVWTRRTIDAFGDWWDSPETKPCAWEYIAKKWAPLTEVIENAAPGIPSAISTSGDGVASEQAEGSVTP